MAFKQLKQWVSSPAYDALPQHSAGDSFAPPPTAQRRAFLAAYLPALTWQKCLSFTLQLALVLLACVGISMMVEEKLGRIARVHRLTPQELGQAGWARPSLTWPVQGSAASRPAPQDSVTVRDYRDAESQQQAVDDQHLLILTPCRNCAKTLPIWFEQVTRLRHPKAQTSIGFLVGDEDDNTAELMTDFYDKHQSEYRRLTLLRKDFPVPNMLQGAARHSSYLQDQRRQIMAKVRTFLLTSTLEPSVDWVLWLDSDVFNIPPTLFEDLLMYGNAGLSSKSHLDATSEGLEDEFFYDVITPNIYRPLKNGGIHSYDVNNWAETPASLRMKESLAEDAVLVEGNILHPTYRTHLPDAYRHCNVSEYADALPSELPSEGALDRFDPTSPAYLGARMPLDAVGGVSTLVRATAHRVGAIFPAFIVDHQVETEGFGVLARALGARIVGLPNYVVLHRSAPDP